VIRDACQLLMSVACSALQAKDLTQTWHTGSGHLQLLMIAEHGLKGQGNTAKESCKVLLAQHGGALIFRMTIIVLHHSFVTH